MNGGGLLSRLLSAALALLLAAVAIHWAIGLLSEVWVGVLITALAVASTVAAVSWWRRRSSGW